MEQAAGRSRTAGVAGASHAAPLRRIAARSGKAAGLLVVVCLMIGGDLSYDARAARERDAATNADSGGSRSSDVALRWLIQTQFRADRTIDDRRIDVTAWGGVVTLSGLVDSERTRSRAIALAERVRGVTAVNDQLQVERSRRRAE